MRRHSLLLAFALLSAPAAFLVGPAAACSPQPVHAYVAGSSVEVDARALDKAVGVATLTVLDTNVLDCDGDGVPFDADGDHDFGFNGAAFGWGPWADACGWSRNVHGPYVSVADAVSANVPFIIGEDDQDGPVSCATDGVIDPASDPDDCLTPLLWSRGRTCGTGGGDGLFWVFFPTLARDAPLRVDGAAAGTILATAEP